MIQHPFKLGLPNLALSNWNIPGNSCIIITKPFIHNVQVDILFLALYVNESEQDNCYIYFGSTVKATAFFQAPDSVSYHYRDINL